MPDESAADDGESLRERVADLEQTVSDQQQTIQKLMPSRRQTIAGLGLVGAGVGAGRLSSETARAQAAGQQGTEEEPNDMFAWDLDVQNGVTSDLPMNGNDLTGVGALETDRVATTDISAVDVTSSRSGGTWYQAPIDQDLYFNFGVEVTSDGTTVAVRVDINDTQSQDDSLINPTDDFESGDRPHYGGIKVPAGHYYKVEFFGDSEDYSLFKWSEIS